MDKDIQIIAVVDKAQEQQFIDLPYQLYKGEPHWRAPLRFERKAQINPAKNPGLEGLEFQFFLALKNGMPSGRIAAIKNPEHLRVHKDNTGHFGFLDTDGDPAVAEALLGASEEWLKARGLSHIAGPFSFSINEETGLPITGFDTPPMLMMPYNRETMPGTLDALGFEKAKDMHAYITNIPGSYPHPQIVRSLADFVDASPDITLRRMRKGNFLADIEMAMEIFNDAWAENWGFLPFSDAQIKHMATELKPVIIPDLFWICEVDGKPAAFIIMIPNINEAIEGLDGRLLPFGWAKMLWRLKVKGLKTARIPLMGVRKEYQRTKPGLAMAAALCATAFDHGRERGIEEVEMSWILEDNKSMIRIIKMASGEPYKTYRVYKKAIA